MPVDTLTPGTISYTFPVNYDSTQPVTITVRGSSGVGGNGDLTGGGGGGGGGSGLSVKTTTGAYSPSQFINCHIDAGGQVIGTYWNDALTQLVSYGQNGSNAVPFDPDNPAAVTIGQGGLGGVASGGDTNTNGGDGADGTPGGGFPGTGGAGGIGAGSINNGGDGGNGVIPGAAGVDGFITVDYSVIPVITDESITHTLSLTQSVVAAGSAGAKTATQTLLLTQRVKVRRIKAGTRAHIFGNRNQFHAFDLKQ